MKVIDFFKKPILANSINISGEKPINDINEIKKFSNRIKEVVLSYKKMSNIPSIVFIFENGKRKILRRCDKILEKYLIDMYNSINKVI